MLVHDGEFIHVTFYQVFCNGRGSGEGNRRLHTLRECCVDFGASQAFQLIFTLLADDGNSHIPPFFLKFVSRKTYRLGDACVNTATQTTVGTVAKNLGE